MSWFLGLRGSGDFDSNQRPKSYRAMILKLYPNGDMPLTGLTSLMKKEAVDDPEYNWFTKTFPRQGGAVTGVYTDVMLSSAYATGATAGTTLYVKMAAATAGQIRVGHQVLLRDASNYTVDVNAKVTAVVINGDSSYCAVRLLEADDNGSGNDLSDCDTILVIGNLNAEGAPMPDAISQSPTKIYNYTQIFRTSLSITRTARKTKLRTGDAYQEMKTEALEMHGVEMEKAFLWSIPTEGTGSNGQPERSTMGLIPFIKTYSSNVSAYNLATSYAGKTWLQGGRAWLAEQLANTFKYGSGQKLGFCGLNALLAINELAEDMGWMQLTPTQNKFGINIHTWVTPTGELNLKLHPLFSYEATNLRTLVIFEPKNVRYRFIDDTDFYSDAKKQNTGKLRYDSTDEEWLTECGLEFHYPEACAYLEGLGANNSL